MSIIAAVQMCSTDDVHHNLNVVSECIARAALKGASMIVLPEMFAMMGKTPNDSVNIKETYGDGIIQNTLSMLAMKHKIWIVGGTIPIKDDKTNKIRAACIVYNEKGQAVARYDKIHLFDATLSQQESYRESDTVSPGDQAVVVETPFGRLGLAVCYDIRFPKLFIALRERGADIIALPAAFTAKTGEAHWHVLMRARAIENFCYMVGATQGGTHVSGRKTYGHAMIIEPWGGVLAQTQTDNADIICAKVELEKLIQLRESIPVQLHQREM